MRIKRFNENIENEDFISIEDIKSIISHLYDTNTNIEIVYSWADVESLRSSGTLHLSENKENDTDVKVARVNIIVTDKKESSIALYFDYGVDYHALKNGEILDVSNILKEIHDITPHLKSEGYDIYTSVTTIGKIHCEIIICKLGDLSL